jgi:tetratricopeptide (TPR) repeat protein
MGRPQEAVEQYNTAISDFETLSARYPNELRFNQSLAYAHNWLGETVRAALDGGSGSRYSPSDAEKQYSQAISLQEDLLKQSPTNATYQQELARTYYNRGIIRFRIKNADGMRSDFHRAIELLEPLGSKIQPSQDSSNPSPAQDLARVYNDYAIAADSAGQPDQAQGFYEKAIALSEQLVTQRPKNREYRMELAKYSINEARMLADGDQVDLAVTRTQRALELLEQLTEPAASLSLKEIEALQLKGQLVQSQNPAEARALTDQALDLLNKVDTNEASGALYMNIGANYLELAQYRLLNGDRTGAAAALSHLNEILPHLSAADRKTLTESYQNVQRKMQNGPIRH